MAQSELWHAECAGQSLCRVDVDGVDELSVVKIGTRSSGHVGRSRTLLKPPSICSYSAGSAVRLEIKKRLSPHLYRRLREEIPIEILISSCTLCELKTWFLQIIAFSIRVRAFELPQSERESCGQLRGHALLLPCHSLLFR